MELSHPRRIEGKLEGKIESQLEIAKRLLAENVEIPFISKITGLSVSKIKELQNEQILV